MRPAKGFLYVSLMSYVAMLIFVINDISIANDMAGQQESGLLTSGIFCLIMIYSLYENNLNLVWCGVFGAWAFVSFLGLIQWQNYFGNQNINLYMSLWDLLIGIAMYYESELFE